MAREESLARIEKSVLTGAEERAARKELAAVERKIEKLSEHVSKIHGQMAAHDHADYEGLGRMNEELQAVEAEVADLEERWLELSEALG